MRKQNADRGGGGEKGGKASAWKLLTGKRLSLLMFCVSSPVGCEPAQRASQEIPDERILQEGKAERSVRQLPARQAENHVSKQVDDKCPVQPQHPVSAETGTKDRTPKQCPP